MTVLVVAAHPDDEVLGCGGTICRWAEEGVDVAIAILGEGLASRSEPGDSDAAALEALKEDARRAARVLGAGTVEFSDLPDNRFDTVPLLDVTKTIEELIARLRPEVVITQHGGDLNVDHQITFRAALIATRPIEGCTVREVLAYEVPSSTEWSFHSFEPRFHPNTFVDVSDTINRKIEAMACYESESRPFPHPRSAEALRAIAQRHGSSVGCQAAEAFQAIRVLR